MTTFIQLHILTAYPAANLNRDDTGRPKTAQFGGAERLRVSSQALKRAWRTSAEFSQALEGHIGERTQRLGDEIVKHLRAKGAEDGKAQEIARAIATRFGKPKAKNDPHPVRIEQLAFISPQERAQAFAVAELVIAGESVDIEKTELLKKADGAIDIAMFGRMLADDPEFNRNAAVQVAHAITTHRAVVEDDYYTAVDDLKDSTEDAGAGFVGEAGFGSGVFYIYVCIDRDLLVRNLAGDAELADRGIGALIRAAATVSPCGKQASYASRARASYLLAERGEAAPRTLAAAFLKPVRGEDILLESVRALEKQRCSFAAAYGEEPGHAVMSVAEGHGTLQHVITFATGRG
jgi:CRISPR system Cascade subunit CasC